MDHDLQDRLTYELKLQKAVRKDYSARLDILEPYLDTRIKQTMSRNGKRYYYARPDRSVDYKYIGDDSATKVLRIKEAAHLKKSVKQLDSNIKLLESVLDGLLPYDFSAVDLQLPKAYRSDDLIVQSQYAKAGSAWKSDRIAFQKEFPENFPDKKTETTCDGTPVKSKNEVIIYNTLFDAGLYVVYELPFVSGDYGPPMYPDFTILSPIDLKTEIIIEHIGLLDELRYREDFARKIARYIKNGYIPGVNLFFTFNDMYGHIDSLQIKKIIADILGIR